MTDNPFNKNWGLGGMMLDLTPPQREEWKNAWTQSLEDTLAEFRAEEKRKKDAKKKKSTNKCTTLVIFRSSLTDYRSRMNGELVLAV